MSENNDDIPKLDFDKIEDIELLRDDIIAPIHIPKDYKKEK